MLTKTEAEQLAKAVNALRPDWSQASLMAVLGDERCRLRPRHDISLAFVALALDDQSRKPTRIYEHGPWWEILRPIGQTAPNYRAVLPTDCGICSRPFEFHSALSKLDDHEYEPLADRKPGVGPTPEQKAAIKAARVEAELARTAAREEQPKREIRDPASVIAAHTEQEHT